jgi:hypothetical protein
MGMGKLTKGNPAARELVTEILDEVSWWSILNLVVQFLRAKNVEQVRVEFGFVLDRDLDGKPQAPSEIVRLSDLAKFISSSNQTPRRLTTAMMKQVLALYNWFYRGPSRTAGFATSRNSGSWNSRRRACPSWASTLSAPFFPCVWEVAIVLSSGCMSRSLGFPLP